MSSKANRKRRCEIRPPGMELEPQTGHDAGTRPAAFRILVITDQVRQFEKIERLCRQWPTIDARLTWESDAKEAASIIAQRRYDVALVDDCGTINAVDVLQRSTGEGSPSIVVFAEHDSARGEIVLEAGATDWVTAPELSPQLLERVIHYAFDRERVLNLLRSSQERARHRASHDALTGLPNRATFLDRIEAVLARSRVEPSYHFCVLVVDLDRFKVINESLGHQNGDRLIVEAARRLKRALSSLDTLARLGGDEFGVLMDSAHDLRAAEGMAAALQAQCSDPFLVDTHSLHVSTSIGISFVESSAVNPEEVLLNADTAMYGAKSRGGSCYTVFGEEMRSQAMRLFDLETELRLAVENEEFEVFYQPIYDVASGDLNGAEALVRWRHPRHGVVSPAEFIPLAEETGLIVEIGQQVLHQACRQAAQWNLERRNGPPLSISVNISPVQFHKGVVMRDVLAALASSGLSPHALRIEITESLLMQEISAAVRVLRELGARGIAVDLDDFGTGYSSLSYLADLPVSRLKIDRAFVSAITEGSGRAKIAQAIISLAHSLDLEVTAEGVENEEQLAVLQVLGCQHVQGFLFSRPVPAEDFSALWRSRACA
ncbi:MAG: EAL domain-containing protein [Nannocystaceae bacterium]